MKPSPLSPEWRKKREKMAKDLKNKGELFFKIQDLKKRKIKGSCS